MVLRHFLYLNEDLVSDFFEELIDDPNVNSIKKKFNKLYDELIHQDEIHILNENSTDLSAIQHHSIIEASGILKIPEQYLKLITINNFMDSNLFGFAESLGVTSYPEISKIEKQGEQIKNLTNDNSPVPLIMPAKNTNPIKILTHLSKEYIKPNINDINEKDVFIIGKVIKKIEQRKKYRLYSMFPDIPENREQRRKKKNDSIKEIQVDEIGPALVILPIAIYQ